MYIYQIFIIFIRINSGNLTKACFKIFKKITPQRMYRLKILLNIIFLKSINYDII